MIRRSGMAMILSAGLVVAGTTSANALAAPESSVPEVIAAPAADPALAVYASAPSASADLPVTDLLGTVTGLIGSLVDAVLGVLGGTGPGGTSPGDGTWSPSHDEETAIIPICSGPTATLDWLFVNFSDHGTDLGQFLTENADHIVQIVTLSSDPYETLQYLLTPFLQVPVYAINDTVFHQEATLGDILAFCESARA
ncbi:hypothetical protein [Myceligenerans pegani]|uniref:Uncharacterized protein n=1 Tax=Myceligenerans pegani TaxID=2776917 RepID=A0ABR9MTI4_9MICO|nr:hypothetical protein [Myceligenerans sp. TRM 65318]MBE1874208.1 hypothetical protein [Myceligenerans sp. TRM 65318]MBE3016480.1 hypothetical protein [Myceligenerans sp. TRM 65318]